MNLGIRHSGFVIRIGAGDGRGELINAEFLGGTFNVQRDAMGLWRYESSDVAGRQFAGD
jgi:hypothetical protein